jgi:hypothetical protein
MTKIEPPLAILCVFHCKTLCSGHSEFISTVVFQRARSMSLDGCLHGGEDDTSWLMVGENPVVFG